MRSPRRGGSEGSEGSEGMDVEDGDVARPCQDCLIEVEDGAIKWIRGGG